MSVCSCGAATVETPRHGASVCFAPPIPRPEAFVRLTEAPVEPADPAEPAEPAEHPVINKNVIALRLSREAAIDFGLILPTPEERTERDARAAEHAARVARARREPGPPLTLQSLLTALDWTPAYAAHFLHPECGCDPWGDEPWLCTWATELGFDRVGGSK